MVTTVAAEIGTVASATTMGVRAEGGADESVFAQLLNGVVAAAPPPVMPVPKAANGKAVSTRAADEITQSAAPSAEMLALCGLTVTPSAPPPAVVETDGLANAAADTSIETSIEKPVETSRASVQTLTSSMDPAAVMTLPQTMPVQANAVVDQGLTGTDEAAVLPGTAISSESRAADLQWLSGALRGPAHVAATSSAVETSPAVAAQVVSQAVEQFAGKNMDQVEKHANTDQTTTLEPSALPDDTAKSPEQQPAFQKLMTQITPMMGMVTSQLRESGFDESVRDVPADDAQSAGATLNAASLQPAGTQLAHDSPTLEMSPRHHLQATVGTHQWATELGNKLTMMATQDTQSATLYMTPADLGPVQVRIDLHDDQASVWFTAEHAETRSALEQSLPKLREMFTAQGMSLTDAGVFGDRSRQQQTENSFTPSRFQGLQYEDSDALADTAVVRSISLGMLDAYA